jgi:hypothetical protein
MARSSTAVRLTVVPLLAASFLAGCGEDEEETAYCVDENNEVVENRYCDDEHDGVTNSGAFFWYFAGAGVGNVVRGQRLSGGGERISARDRAALANRGGFGSRSSSGSGVGKSVSASGGGSRSGGG